MQDTITGPPPAAAARDNPDDGRIPRPKAGVRRRTAGWLYMSPLALVLITWIYGPMLSSAVLSFTDWNLTTDFNGFVGLENYASVLDEPELLQSVANTAFYAAALLPFATLVPMGLAIMLWQRESPASHVYRALLFLPVMIAPVANAVSWKFLLNPLQGLANSALEVAGLPAVNWLGDPAIAPWVIVCVTAAHVTAFNMMVYSASLSTIDRRTLAAALVDGATQPDITRFIVIPQLARTTILLGLLDFVLAGQWVFNNVSVLTQGGPDGSTDNLYFRIYTLGFTFFETGAASAASMMVLAAFAFVWVIATAVQNSRTERKGT